MTAKEYRDQTTYCADEQAGSSMNETLPGERFLESIRNLDLEITALDHERVRLSNCRQDILDKARSLSGPLDGVRVQHGPWVILMQLLITSLSIKGMMDSAGIIHLAIYAVHL